MSNRLKIILFLLTLTFAITSSNSPKKLNKKSLNSKNETCITVLVKKNPLKEDFSKCDLISQGPVCSFNGDRVILPIAKQKGLIGYWNFDEKNPLDSSGNMNHGIGRIRSGPSFSGLGASSKFKKGSFVRVPFDKQFYSFDFTITFWIFLVEDYYTNKKGSLCPLIQRGLDDSKKKIFERNPAIFLDRTSKNLKIFLKTNDEKKPEGEVLVSNAKIANQRWLHIAVVKGNNNLRLYVNGILDSQILLKGDIVINQGDFYIGNTPSSTSKCTFPFYLDELRYYDSPVSEFNIQAEASPALGGIEPGFLQFGCKECSLSDASNSCIDGYHLCTSIELHTGGYQVSRAMGWLDWNTHIWSHGALKSPGDFKSLKGLAVCCMDLK